MNPLLSNIPRLGETKTKPKIGEIRLTIDGTRRKVFDGRCWQYLCIGDPNCRIQAKFTCRHHKNSNSSFDESLLNKSEERKPGDTQLLPNGHRRIWRGARWHSLCRVENCLIQAKDFCKTHQNQRLSLPNTTQNVSQITNRTRSCTLNDTIEKEESELPSLVQNNTSPELTTNKRRRPDENIFETVALSPLEKRELHTRNGRRVRCNRTIWKHLCADKKMPYLKRKYQRHSMPIKKTDQIKETEQITSSNEIPSILSDTIDSSSTQNSQIIPIENSKKRKTMSDINIGEHIVPKRKTNKKKRKSSNKSITLQLESNSSSASTSDITTKDTSNEEPVLNDSDVSLSLRSNRLNTNSQSAEIPVFNFDSSPSAILEQFGTIIKKEAVVEEESLTCVPNLRINEIESPCETLQDFIRAEELKTKEFKLDCQRISYRLAKIQDCIGSISSITS